MAPPHRNRDDQRRGRQYLSGNLVLWRQYRDAFARARERGETTGRLADMIAEKAERIHHYQTLVNDYMYRCVEYQKQAGLISHPGAKLTRLMQYRVQQLLEEEIRYILQTPLTVEEPLPYSPVTGPDDADL